MKLWFKTVTMLAMAVLTLASCEKDEVKTYLKRGASSQLTASGNTFVLKQEEAANDALTLNWTPSDYGFSAAQNYTIQMAAKGTNFAGEMAQVNVLAANSKKFTVGDLNRELLKIVSFGIASDVDVRVRSFVTDSIAPFYSNVLTLKVTPYQDIIKYRFPQALNIAGNYQGWDPAKAPQIVSITNNGDYEGYINFANDNPEFKMVKGDNWGAGDYGSPAPGELSNGGSNVKLTDGAGVYLLRANTGTMKYTGTKITTWGIIGSATPGDWGASTPMNFDAATGNWTLVATLKQGELKFRANNDWAINFGDNKPSVDGKPEYGGDNIAIGAAGTYTISLNIGIAGNYSYTLKKN